MSLSKQIGDEVVKLSREYRKVDPQLNDSIKGSVIRTLEWMFPDAFVRAVGNDTKKTEPPKNDPDIGSPN